MEEHTREVSKVAESVKRFYERQETFRIFHGSTNSTRKTALGRDPRRVVDTSGLNHVVQVDLESQSALVEPNVPMDKLVEETLKFGLIPPVVMEFPGITVGGGYSGSSGESSSFKYGFFDRTIKQVEMVLANGKIITCSDSHNADLFRGAAGAAGTFGVVTMVEIQLRTATKFVETTYYPVQSMAEAVDKLQQLTLQTDDFDYVDGIMYSNSNGVVIAGRMTDALDKGVKIQRFSDAKDPWYYLYVKERISRLSGPMVDAVPLGDYLFRYDRGGFWVGSAPFDYFTGFPFNDFTRWWLDDFLHARMLFKAMHASGRWEQLIIQDLVLPYANAVEFVERLDSKLGIWPLWLCPLKQSPHPNMHPRVKEYEVDGRTLKPMLNIGVWGKAPSSYEAYVDANRAIEDSLKELGGMKCLYAQVFSSEQSFWEDFDGQWYNSLRRKYNASSLPNIYDKVATNVEAEQRVRASAPMTQKMLDVWPLAGLYGLIKAIESGEYTQARKSTWKEWVPRM